MPMDKSFKYNSRQPLVHRDCHQLPKPNMGAPHVLSISPILVIDDNHFQESLYKELCITMQCNQSAMNEMQMLRNKTKARGDSSLHFSTKLSETSPPLASIAKRAKILEGQYKLWSSINCVFLNKRVECNTHIQR